MREGADGWSAFPSLSYSLSRECCLGLCVCSSLIRLCESTMSLFESGRVYAGIELSERARLASTSTNNDDDDCELRCHGQPMTGSTDADAADADTLPFQLPPSSYSTRQPPTPKPAPTATQRKPARSRSFQGVYIPARPASDHPHRSRAHNDTSSSSPLMGRPKHDGAPTASVSLAVQSRGS